MSDDPTRSRPGQEPIRPDRHPADDGLPELGQREAERLLDGLSADGPIAFRLAGVLAAAAGPARPDELAGEASALTAFRAVRAFRAIAGPEPGQPVAAGAGPGAPERARRQAPRTRNLAGPAARHGFPPAGARSGARRPRTVRAPVVVTTVLLVLGGLGGAAVAAGLTAGVGRPSSSVAHTTRPAAPASSTLPVPSGGAGPTTTGGDSPSAGGGTATSMTDPGLSPAARKRLCRAWSAPGNGEGSGKAEKDAGAMRALAKAAGGTERIDEYCRGSAPSKPPAKKQPDQAAAATPPDAPPTTAPVEVNASTGTTNGPQEQGRGSSDPSAGRSAPQGRSAEDGRPLRHGASSGSDGAAGGHASRL